MRTSNALSLLLVASAAVAWCGSAVAAGDHAGVTVRIGTQASQWADAFKTMAPEFTAETGITLEFDDISFA